MTTVVVGVSVTVAVVVNGGGTEVTTLVMAGGVFVVVDTIVDVTVDVLITVDGGSVTVSGVSVVVTVVTLPQLLNAARPEPIITAARTAIMTGMNQVDFLILFQFIFNFPSLFCFCSRIATCYKSDNSLPRRT